MKKFSRKRLSENNEALSSPNFREKIGQARASKKRYSTSQAKKKLMKNYLEEKEALYLIKKPCGQGISLEQIAAKLLLTKGIKVMYDVCKLRRDIC